MEIWRFINSTEKAKIVLLTISLTIIIWPVCNSRILTDMACMEGESIELDFPYPCYISRVTLRYRDRALSYSSVNPSLVSLPSNQNLTNKNENESNECFLHLTIDPVSRNDAGTYILTGYNGNGWYVYDARVRLRVDYPPGRASCESGGAYSGGEWTSLLCSAGVGNIAGQIICYQNGIRLPPLTKPQEIGERLNQIISARLEGLVYCCSSTQQNLTDLCECKDIGWDPVLDIAITNVTNPCPVMPVVLSSTQADPNVSQSPKDSETAKTYIPATTRTITRAFSGNWKHKISALVITAIVIVLVILAFLILIAVMVFKIYGRTPAYRSLDGRT